LKPLLDLLGVATLIAPYLTGLNPWFVVLFALPVVVGMVLSNGKKKDVITSIYDRAIFRIKNLAKRSFLQGIFFIVLNSVYFYTFNPDMIILGIIAGGICIIPGIYWIMRLFEVRQLKEI